MRMEIRNWSWVDVGLGQSLNAVTGAIVHAALKRRTESAPLVNDGK